MIVGITGVIVGVGLGGEVGGGGDGVDVGDGVGVSVGEGTGVRVGVDVDVAVAVAEGVGVRKKSPSRFGRLQAKVKIPSQARINNEAEFFLEGWCSRFFTMTLLYSQRSMVTQAYDRFGW